MNPPPNALTSAGLAVDQRPARVAADVAADAGRSRGRLHAVPVRDGVSSSHWLAEAVYRGFEVLAALFGLVAGLPLLLILAAMIRYDSPGPVFFFAPAPGTFKNCARPRPQRPSRFVAAAGRLRRG